MKNQLNIDGAIAIVAPTAPEVKSDKSRFDTLKRNFESEYATGNGDGTALFELATAIARSVLSYLKDPRKRADADPEKRKEVVTNSGMNPAMVALSGELYRDCGCYDRPGELSVLRDAVNRAYRVGYTKDNMARTETADPDALAVVDALIVERLGDGVDLAQTACVALLELAQQYAHTGEGWLDAVVTVERLNRKVWVKDGERPTMEVVETAPAKEVYKEVRRAVDNSRAVQADPRNGYSYIEDYTRTGDDGDDIPGLEVIYRRLGKYADLGGYDMNGNYTTPAQSAFDYDDIMKRLNLTPRQQTIIDLRLRGYGIWAIGTQLGVSHQAVENTLKRIQDKSAKFGFTPAMWAEMNR